MPSPPGAITRRCVCASLLGSWRPWLPGLAARLEAGAAGRLDCAQDSREKTVTGGSIAMYSDQCLELPPGAAHALAVGLLKALAPRTCSEALCGRH